MIRKFYDIDLDVLGGGIQTSEDAKSKIEKYAIAKSCSPSDYEFIKGYCRFGYSLAQQEIEKYVGIGKALMEAGTKIENQILEIERLKGLIESSDMVIAHYEESEGLFVTKCNNLESENEDLTERFKRSMDLKEEVLNKNIQANEFIRDIANLLGEDDLGLDGKQWGIDDFKNAIDASRNEKDAFAISFAIWAMYDPQAKLYQESGITAANLLDKYKSRPYINTISVEKN